MKRKKYKILRRYCNNMEMLNDLLIIREVISKDNIVLTYAKKYKDWEMYPVLDMCLIDRALKIFERYDRMIRKEINAKIEKLENELYLELNSPIKDYNFNK